jgi:hypothetical protein
LDAPSPAVVDAVDVVVEMRCTRRPDDDDDDDEAEAVEAVDEAEAGGCGTRARPR